MVELRPDDVDPAAGHFSWWVWRLEDMQFIGHGSMRGKAGGSYWIGAYIISSRGQYTSGYGAEIFRLLRDRAVELGATRVTANAPDPERRSALEAAGFKIVSAVPRRLGKRRRGWGFVRLEWRP